METQIKIKLCKVCGNSSEFHKFKGLLCCKCASRKNNERLNEKQYYRNYYDNNKDILITRSIKYYADNVKPLRNITAICN
jgi:hypothetical protein